MSFPATDTKGNLNFLIMCDLVIKVSKFLSAVDQYL